MGTEVAPGSPRWYRNDRGLIGVRPAKQKAIDELCAMVEAMDIESAGLIGASIAAAATDGDSVRLFRELADLVRYALSRPLMLAHNGAGFDFPRLIAVFFELGLQADYDVNTFFSGDRMLALSFTRKGEKKPASLWLDSYGQVPCSLEKFTKAFAPDVAKLSGTIDFEGGEVWTWDNPQHVEYLRRDVLGLKAAYIAFAREMYAAFGIKLGMSAAGNALRAFKVSMLAREVNDGHFYTYFRLCPSAEKLARKACFGGWVFPGVASRLYTNTVKRDFKGAYGAVMRDAWFPVGTPCYTLRWHAQEAGIYTVRITAPASQWCASVPYRLEDGALRYLAPGATCETTLIAEAVAYYQTIGYRVEIVEGLFWPRRDQVFRPLMLACQAMEAEGGARKDIAKLVRNGLSGRFNLGREAKRLVVSDNPPEGALPVITSHGTVAEHVFEVTEQIDDSCMLPHFYAYITGLHRLKMVKLAMQLGPDNFLYCDTDSIECPVECDDLDVFYHGAASEARYGDITVEAYHSRFKCFGPKHCYSESCGKREARLKGIPRRKLTDAYMLARLEGDTSSVAFSYESPTNARTMLRSAGKAPVGVVRTRTVGWNTSTAWALSDAAEFVPCGAAP